MATVFQQTDPLALLYVTLCRWDQGYDSRRAYDRSGEMQVAFSKAVIMDVSTFVRLL